MKRRKAVKEVSNVRLWASSRCMAEVTMQTNRQM